MHSLSEHACLFPPDLTRPFPPISCERCRVSALQLRCRNREDVQSTTRAHPSAGHHLSLFKTCTEYHQSFSRLSQGAHVVTQSQTSMEQTPLSLIGRPFSHHILDNPDVPHSLDNFTLDIRLLHLLSTCFDYDYSGIRTQPEDLTGLT